MRIPTPHTKGAWIRLILAAAMVLLVVYYMTLTITNRVAIEGRINAEIIPQIAQIDGSLVGDLPKRGQFVRKGEVLAHIRAERVDDRTLIELRQTLNVLSTRMKAQEKVRADLTTESETLAGRRFLHAELMRQRLIATGDELRASLKIAQEDLALAAEALERGQKLRKTETISISQYENLMHAQEKALANTARIEALIAQNKTDQAAISHGVTLSGNYADIPYTTQRMDEIRMKLIFLDGEIRDLSEQIVQGEQRLAAEDRRVSKIAEQVIASPVDGVVWRSRDASGQGILRGDSILDVIDCRKIFVEATVYERFLSRIEVGEPASIKLLGDHRKFEATIKSMMGSAINAHISGNVAVPMRKNPGEATVLLDIDWGEERFHNSMCGVGRTTDVTFSDNGLIGSAYATVRERAAK